MVFRKDKKNSPVIFRFLLYIVLVLVFAIAGAAIFVWHHAFRPNVVTGDDLTSDFYIPTGSDMEIVAGLLDEKGLIKNRATFEWVASRKNYHNNVHPGRYQLTSGMNNNDLVNMLRSGSQVPVNLVFISHRSIEEVAGAVARQIEADSASIVRLAFDEDFLQTIGFDRTTVPGLFIPNTYQVYWNTSARQFFQRMKREYERFWEGERDRKREVIGLERGEVSTLASIVSEETTKFDEMPVIAGVYINRLERGMRLQADPTVKYAIGDFTVNRILRVHLEADSPYNTYRYSGLPPGPITVPPVQAIDAVLDAQSHDYLYFCAREDFSGYHRFARTLAEHNRNARLYQNALNQRRVFR